MAIPERILRIELGDSQVEINPGQKGVLESLARGLKHREIANELGIPVSTMGFRIQRLYSLFGIDGYSPDRRLQLVRKAIQFGYLPPETDLSPLEPPPIPFASEKLKENQLLTYREKQTVVLVVLGMTDKEIAKELEKSPETVKNHISAILGKLDIDNRTELMIKAISEGWVDIALLKEKFAEQIARLETLTPREMEVLGKVTEGLFNKEIAQSLEISDQTVKNHVGNIFVKLNVRSRTEAALIYLLEHPPAESVKDESTSPSHERLHEHPGVDGW